MLLSWHFDDPGVNLVLELFLRIIRDELGESLVSVMLYGSILYGDLAPGYGDLDFLAVVDGDLDESQCGRLIRLRAPLRSGYCGVHCQMLEGAFLPVSMLDPTRTGSAVWWGTSGERLWERNELGHFVLHTVREHGLVIWGEDVRPRIPEVRRIDILNDLLSICRNIREHLKPTSLQYLDFLFTPARELLWLNEGELSSKCEAADWGYTNAKGEWRRHLPQAKLLRQHPLMANCRDVQEWIKGLGPAMHEAYDELEEALKRAIGADGPPSGSA